VTDIRQRPADGGRDGMTESESVTG